MIPQYNIECSKCKLKKSYLDFSPDKKNKSGRYSHCKVCKAKTRALEYRKKRQKNPRLLWSTNTINWAKGRKKHPVTIDRFFILSLLDKQKDKCFYCDKNFNYRSSMKERIDSPSMDRVNPNLGYIESNIVISCYRCNQIKSDASIEELQNIIDRINKFNKK